jgi:hypothetical protein
MSSTEWRKVPIGLDAPRWVTRTGCRQVVVAVHTVTSGQRLHDVVQTFAGDFRIQVVFTMAPDVFSNGVPEFLRGLGAVVLPWEQAIRTRFDLALAASYGGVQELHAPLIVMPHGAGRNKLVPPGRAGGVHVSRGTNGLQPHQLLLEGAVVPSAIVFSHRDGLTQLAQACPEALPVAAVVGDPCYDRLVASLPYRHVYRDALRVTASQRLVVMTSTWGRNSLFGKADVLVPRLLAQLPRHEFRLVALIHPNAWYGHGPWQVRAWLAEGRRSGLGLVPPEADWRGVLAAADCIIGDHGSATLYGAALGVPTLLGSFPEGEVDPASPAAALAATAPRFGTNRPAAKQLDRAMAAGSATTGSSIAGLLTSEPGRFNRNMGRLMYRMLRLRRPASVPVSERAELPWLVD